MAKKNEKENFENSELVAYYQNMYSKIETTTLDDPYGAYVLNRIKGGQKTVFNKSLTELRNFDMSFLDTIESVYPAILKIMRDPKKSIRYEEEIVAVEKAKKVNSQTVRHLSSHTQLIKEITTEGDVIPSKVLTTYAEEELAIYENRFLKSLVKRIEMFLERRYEVMKVSLESFETQRLNVSNEFLMSGQKITLNLDIQIKNDLTTNVEATKEQYNRLLYVREMIQGLKGTEFMRALAKARDVLPPIMKTNLIMHNPDFKLCYGLWLYLDKYDGISTNIDVKEKTFKYTPIFEKDINEVMALALTAFIKNREIEGIYTSKNLPSLKAPKIQNNEEIELEMNFSADTKKLEDYTMNQILLDETAKYFEGSLAGNQRAGATYVESIKVVYRQMLDMLDQLYPRTFGVADDQLESKNLYEQLEFARRRAIVLKMVHQQKQMNILRMGKEEKRVEKLIANLENKIRVQEQKERERLEKQRAKEEAQRLAAIEKAKQLEEKRRRLEKEALAKQRAAERKALERENKKQAADSRKLRQKELQLLRRERLKQLKEGTAEEVTSENVVLDIPESELIEQEPVAEVAADEAINIENSNEEAITPQDAELTDNEQAVLDAIPEANEEQQDEEVKEEDVPAEETPVEEVSQEELQEAEPAEEEIPTDEAQEVNDPTEEPALEELQGEAQEATANDSELSDEELAMLDAIPEANEEQQAEEAAEDIPVENVAQDEAQEAPANDSELSDEELAMLDAIPEADSNTSPDEEFSEDELALLDAIPEAPTDENGLTEEELAMLDAIPEASNDAEEVVYVDEDGNVIEGYEEPNLDDIDFDALENQAADDYEKMLKESGMTDEEIAALLGED